MRFHQAFLIFLLTIPSFKIKPAENFLILFFIPFRWSMPKPIFKIGILQRLELSQVLG